MNFLTEMIRVVSFRITAAIQGSGLDEDTIPDLIKQLKGLWLVSQRVESAAKISEQHASQIREEARKRATERGENAATRKGLGAGSCEAIKREILGIPSR